MDFNIQISKVLSFSTGITDLYRVTAALFYIYKIGDSASMTTFSMRCEKMP